MNARTLVAWLWTGALAVGVVVTGIGIGVGQGMTPVDAGMLVVAIFYSLLGLLVATRQPGNRIAWLLLAVASWLALSGVSVLVQGEGAAPPDPVTIQAVLALAWDNSAYFLFLIDPLLLFFFLFPTGRFLTRRWAWAGWIGGVLVCGAPIGQVLAVRIGPSDQQWTIANPIGFLQPDVPVLQVATALGLVVLLVGGVMAIVARFRRSDFAVRSQIKWVVYGLFMMLVSFVVSSLASVVGWDWVSSALFLVVLVAIPVSIVLAITRYRLYDIDRIISRTFGYLIVVAVLGLVYGVGAVWLPTAILGDQSSLFVAASTLAAAALFNPLRRLVLERVNRRFNRARYDSERVLEEFAADLRNLTDIRELSRDSLEVVRRTMQPQSMGIWVRAPEES